MIRSRSLRLGCLLLLCFAARAGQAANLPQAPTRYVEDRAALLSPTDVESLNNRLADFERKTSNQLVVAIYPKLPEGAELAQFCTDTFQSWGVGQKKEDNGVVLFVFPQDRKMFIATGRGLEGALPDATCKTIITQEITPPFKQGNYAQGIDAGVTALMAAAQGEYQGTGKTHAETQGNNDTLAIPPWLIFVIIVAFVILSSRFGGSRPMIYTRGGSGPWSGGGGWGGGGGGGSSGGFSGGGGGTAGGGAGGSW